MSDFEDDELSKALLESTYCKKHKGLWPHECGCNPVLIECISYDECGDIYDLDESDLEEDSEWVCDDCYERLIDELESDDDDIFCK